MGSFNNNYDFPYTVKRENVILSREASGYVQEPYFITDGGYKYGLKEFDSKYKWNLKIQEENMGTKLAGDKLNISDVQVGDTITVTRDVVVSSVDSSEGVVVEKGTGNKIRLQQPRLGSFSGKTLPTYAVTLKSRPVQEPKNWPPQAGDKWRVGSSLSGTEYTIQQNSYKRTYSTTAHLSAVPDNNYDDISINLDQLQKKNPVLVYRRGGFY